jgi:hypothetical protein
MEDKVAFVTLNVLIQMFQQRDPGLSGLAYVLLLWRKFRDLAYQAVQELEWA